MTRDKIDLRNPIFNDDNAAREYLESVLWPQVRFVRVAASWVIGSRKCRQEHAAGRLQLQGLPQAV